MNQPDCLGAADAFGAIQRILDEGDETVGYTAHARSRMDERSVTADDVLNVLRTGMVAASEWNDMFKNCTYDIRGLDCDRARLSVVVAIQPAHCRITLITVKDA